MYAIIQTGGKQYRVSEGDVVFVEKLGLAEGENVEFDKILVYSDGSNVTVGSPFIKNAKVAGSIVENGKSDKVIIFKYKSKKDYRKKRGHRQPFTKVKIEKIEC